MITGQGAPIPFSCPRCGGPMYKPAGSTFYWHATSDHRPCSITNLAEIPTVVPDNEPVVETPRRQPKKKRM